MAECHCWRLGQEIAVDHRVERHVLGAALCREELLRGQRAQLGEGGCAQALREGRAFLLGVSERARSDVLHHPPALADRAGNVATRQRRRHQRADRDRSSGFAADHDVARVPAERRDVALHPLQCRHLIEQAVIAGRVMRRARGQLGVGEEAENAEPIIHRHDDDPASCKRGAVVALLRSVAGHEPAAIDIHQDRQFAAPRAVEPGRSPDIQIETVLARRGRAEHHVGEERLLHAARPELGGVADARPAGDRLRLAPPQIACRWRCKRNAPEDPQRRWPGLCHALELAALDRDHRIARGLCRRGQCRQCKHEPKRQSRGQNYGHSVFLCVVAGRYTEGASGQCATLAAFNRLA